MNFSYTISSIIHPSLTLIILFSQAFEHNKFRSITFKSYSSKSLSTLTSINFFTELTIATNMNANNILPNATHANNASTITDTLWDGYQRSLNSGARALIELPMQLKSVIGSDGIQVLADRLRFALSPLRYQFRTPANLSYSDFIQAPISVSDVVSRSVVKIEPAKLPKRYVRGLPRRKLSTTKAKDPDRILRPPNSWILYRKHHHRLIKARDPAKLNNDICKLPFNL